MRTLLIITLFLISSFNVSADIVNSENSNFKIKETDSYGLALEYAGEDILIQEYTGLDRIEAVSYMDYIIYNGAAGIGLFIYDVASKQSYLLNRPGSYNSAIFYNKFDIVNDKLFIDVGIEAASMPKICIYDLQKMSKVLDGIDDIANLLQEAEDSQYSSLKKFTENEDISYCTIDDGKYYYEAEFTSDEKLNYILCEDSICEEEDFDGGKVYESDWNGENIELIEVFDENNEYIKSNEQLGNDIVRKNDDNKASKIFDPLYISILPVMFIFGVVGFTLSKKTRRKNKK